MTELKYLVVSLVLAAVIVLNLPLPASMHVRSTSRDAMVPFQNVMYLTLSCARDWLTVVFQARTVLRQRQAIQEQLVQLQEKVRTVQDLQLENDQLRKQLDYARRARRKLVPCEVVVRNDTGGWWRSVRLSKGSIHGIRDNMAVITADGLLGRTLNVSRLSCDALLLTDTSCEVACRFLRSGALGILRGGGTASTGRKNTPTMPAAMPCTMDYVDKNLQIVDGDEIVTSGLGGVFPEGLLVGHARSSVMDPSGLFQRIEVTPAADLSNPRYVFVVQN